MTIQIGVNGFGRIGRAFVRRCLDHPAASGRAAGRTRPPTLVPTRRRAARVEWMQRQEAER